MRSRTTPVKPSYPGTSRDLQRLWATTALVFCLCGIVQAEDPEDELGNWLIYNGTVRFSDHWTLFTEGQVRLWLRLTGVPVPAILGFESTVGRADTTRGRASFLSSMIEIPGGLN